MSRSTTGGLSFIGARLDIEPSDSLPHMLDMKASTISMAALHPNVQLVSWSCPTKRGQLSLVREIESHNRGDSGQTCKRNVCFQLLQLSRFSGPHPSDSNTTNPFPCRSPQQTAKQHYYHSSPNTPTPVRKLHTAEHLLSLLPMLLLGIARVGSLSRWPVERLLRREAQDEPFSLDKLQR